MIELETIRLFIVFALIFIKPCNPNKSLRIEGGVPVPIEMFPHMAQLLYKPLKFIFCGGAVITDRVIVTAAHCLTVDIGLISTNLIAVRLGSAIANQGTKYNVCKIRSHKKYNSDSVPNYYYDIGLLQLKNKIMFNEKVKPIEIGPVDRWKKPKYTLSVTGFGLTSSTGPESNVLKGTRMRYVDRHTCNQTQTVPSSDPMMVPPHMFCLIAERWTGDCFGDSGSGIVWKRYLVGVVATGRDESCGNDMLPSMYTDVTYFKQWIDHKIEEMNAIASCEDTEKDGKEKLINQDPMEIWRQIYNRTLVWKRDHFRKHTLLL